MMCATFSALCVDADVNVCVRVSCMCIYLGILLCVYYRTCQLDNDSMPIAFSLFYYVYSLQISLRNFNLFTAINV